MVGECLSIGGLLLRFESEMGEPDVATMSEMELFRVPSLGADALVVSLPRSNNKLYAAWEAYATVALPFGVVPVHASAVVNKGRAVLCLGESGTGKSTHTSLWVRCIDGSKMLNDDSPLLRVDAEGVQAFGSPWSGKMPCFSTEHYPVSALVRLCQAPFNRIERLGVAEAMSAVLPSCPPPLMAVADKSEQVVDWVAQLVAQVPVYRLHCRPDADAAKLCYEAVM